MTGRKPTPDLFSCSSICEPPVHVRNCVNAEDADRRATPDEACDLGHEDCGWTTVHNATAGRKPTPQPPMSCVFHSNCVTGERRAEGREATPEEGRVRPPYGGIERCVNNDCREPLGEERGVYMHTNRESGKIIMFCGPCSRQAQLYDSLRFPLVAL